MTAATQLQRIVQLVADLSRDGSDEGRRLSDLSAAHGVSEKQIAKDIGTLTTLCDHAEAEWLLSVSAWQQDDRVSVSSMGPFRRPILLTPDERLALQVALLLDPEGGTLAAKLAEAGQLDGAAEPASPHPASPHDLPARLVQAATARRRMRVLYAGEGSGAGRESRIEPHEVLSYAGRMYVHAWDVEGDGWRLFRLDRFLEVELTDGAFDERDDFEPVAGRGDLFRAPPSAVEKVRVRFSPRVARWIRERYPRGVPQDDGSVIVTFLASSVDWLVRRVLGYGADAEVLGPEAYREAVRRAVA